MCRPESDHTLSHTEVEVTYFFYNQSMPHLSLWAPSSAVFNEDVFFLHILSYRWSSTREREGRVVWWFLPSLPQWTGLLFWLNKCFHPAELLKRLKKINSYYIPAKTMKSDNIYHIHRGKLGAAQFKLCQTLLKSVQQNSFS